MKPILVIRYSALGDVVLATGLVAGLRAKYPGARIDWLTAEAYAPLLHGLVDRVIGFRRDARAQVLNEVRGRYGLAIDLQHKVFSQRVARAAARERVSFAKRSAWQALASLLGRDAVLDDAHATTLYARAVGVEPAAPVLPDNAAERASELLSPGTRWVAVAPGASKANKRWPSSRLAEVAQALRSDGYRLALAGGAMDGELLDALRLSVDVDLSAEPLAVVASALKRAALLIGNDSGLVHVATAMGTPALALFGPTSFKRWGPPPPGVALSLKLPCSPCSNHGAARCPLGHHDCLAKLDTAQVLAEARRILANADS